MMLSVMANQNKRMRPMEESCTSIDSQEYYIEQEEKKQSTKIKINLM